MKHIRSRERITPFYKVQWFDTVSLTWRDARGRWPTLEAARAGAPVGVRSRVTEVVVRDGKRFDVAL